MWAHVREGTAQRERMSDVGIFGGGKGVSASSERGAEDAGGTARVGCVVR